MKNFPSNRASRDNLAREQTCKAKFISFVKCMICQFASEIGRFRTELRIHRIRNSRSFSIGIRHLRWFSIHTCLGPLSQSPGARTIDFSGPMPEW